MARVWALAKFTEDMAETLNVHFERFAQNGVVTLAVTDRGLWIRRPAGGLSFLGKATIETGDTRPSAGPLIDPSFFDGEPDCS